MSNDHTKNRRRALKARKGKANNRRIACWIFACGFSLFLMGVYLFQGSQVSAVQHKLLGLFGAICAAAFAAFLPGSIGITLNSSQRPWFAMTVKATGAMAVFVLSLYWWNSYAPIYDRSSHVRIDIKNLVASLEAKYENFRLELENEKGGLSGRFVSRSQKEKALLDATRMLRDSLIGIVREMPLNEAEQRFVRTRIKKLEELDKAEAYKRDNAADGSPNEQVTETNGPPTVGDKTQSPTNKMVPSPDMTDAIASFLLPSEMNMHVEGTPSSVVVVYSEASEALSAKLSQEFGNTIGKFAEYYFVKNPFNNSPPDRASLVYVGADSKDMAGCAEYIRAQVLQLSPQLKSSLRVFDVPDTERPSMPPYEDGITATWRITKIGVRTNGFGFSSNFELVETEVPIREIANRGEGLFPSRKDRGSERAQRVVWVYLP